MFQLTPINDENQILCCAHLDNNTLIKLDFNNLSDEGLPEISELFAANENDEILLVNVEQELL